jgi:hypothetical protein
MEHGMDGVPLLAENHRSAALVQIGEEHFAQEKRRE